MNKAIRIGMIFVQTRKQKIQVKELSLIHYLQESFHLMMTQYHQRYTLYEIFMIHAQVLMASNPLKHEEAKYKEEWRNLMKE